MKLLYLLCHADCDGKLHFAIKMDETEVVKGTKLERVSLVLMNIQSSDASMSKSDNLSVQSQYNTWWLGAFKVDKESHEVLKWVFNQTNIPKVKVRGKVLL